MLYRILLASFFLIFVSGCSDKQEVAEFNKPAIYWYKQMMGSVHEQDLEKADDYYTSLQSEHINSPLLPEAMLVLAKAHMDEEEYLLAEFYIDEYIKRFGTRKNIDFAKHLKIKANYFAFNVQGRDQQLLIDTIVQAEKFIQENPYSSYRPIVDTMLLKMYLADLSLNKQISELYVQMDKADAADFYSNKMRYEWLKNIIYEDPDMAWYRQMFNW